MKECYTNLFGSAEYRLRLEDDLSFAASMTSNGHALVKGKFQERPDVNNVFEFEMETDQTCLPPVFQGIDRLQDIYGGMQGVG